MRNIGDSQVDFCSVNPKYKFLCCLFAIIYSFIHLYILFNPAANTC